MASLTHPHGSKIPGGGMPLAQRENHVKDLTKLTKVDLLEIKEREEKLLSNKSKLNRLPDKGKRIKDFYEKVLREFERRTNVDEAAAMFSELNIATKGQETSNQLEWNGDLRSRTTEFAEDVLDSDDEIDLDPLRIIAQRTLLDRRLKILPPEPQLITADDLADIKSFVDSKKNECDNELEVIVDAVVENVKPKLENTYEKTPNSNSNKDDSSNVPELDQHARYLMEMADLAHPPEHAKFLPYKTTKTNVHTPENERARKQGKYWEITAATPPPLKHSGAQLLTLLDSVEIQTNYLAKLKILQEAQATERLALKIERLKNFAIKVPNPEELMKNAAFSAYRTPADLIEGKQQSSEDDEVYDPLDLEQSGGISINYTLNENDNET